MDGGCAEPCPGLGVTGCFCGDARTYCGAGSVCAEVDQDVGCIPECNGESGAEACWCEFNDQLSTTVCKDGNRCTNEGCKCGDKAPCTNGSTCKDGVCICVMMANVVEQMLKANASAAYKMRMNGQSWV